MPTLPSPSPLPPLPFIKMHGLGNDYVYVDAFTHPPQILGDLPILACTLSDRHFGVGADGLILVCPPDAPEDAHAKMRMFNADGSESEMCGNGIRCVCKYLHDHPPPSFASAPADVPNPLRIQTGAGTLTLDYTLDDDNQVNQVTVDMGTPILDLPSIPVDADRLDDQLAGAIFVSMGNPHAVLYVDDPQVDLAQPELGARLEHHPAFPNRINIHFVRVRSRSEVEVYHWERGSGPTLACGTGACAVAVAGILTGRTDSQITAHLPGGPLTLEWKNFTLQNSTQSPSTGGHALSGRGVKSS